MKGQNVFRPYFFNYNIYIGREGKVQNYFRSSIFMLLYLSRNEFKGHKDRMSCKFDLHPIGLITKIECVAYSIFIPLAWSQWSNVLHIRSASQWLDHKDRMCCIFDLHLNGLITMIECVAYSICTLTTTKIECVAYSILYNFWWCSFNQSTTSKKSAGIVTFWVSASAAICLMIAAKFNPSRLVYV